MSDKEPKQSTSSDCFLTAFTENVPQVPLYEFYTMQLPWSPSNCMLYSTKFKCDNLLLTDQKPHG